MTYHNAHAARIDDDAVVQEVIVIPYMDDDDEKVTAYCHSIGIEGRWIDTSYLGARRGRFGLPGMRYDAELDEFVSPQPAEPVTE